MKTKLMILATLTVSTSPSLAAPLAPATTALVRELCTKIESYQPGSEHYFLCLSTGKRLLKAGVTGTELVLRTCDEVRDLFYDRGSYDRCRQDGASLVGG